MPGSRGGEIRQGVRKVVVDEDNHGQRVDNYLMAQIRDVPRSIIYRIIRKGEVRVNKGRVKPDTRLNTGDEVRIPPVTRKEKPAQVVPGSRVQGVMQDAVVFENDQMLVVNKPSGIAVQGGSGLDFGLIEVLRAARPTGLGLSGRSASRCCGLSLAPVSAVFAWMRLERTLSPASGYWTPFQGIPWLRPHR